MISSSLCSLVFVYLQMVDQLLGSCVTQSAVECGVSRALWINVKMKCVCVFGVMIPLLGAYYMPGTALS